MRFSCKSSLLNLGFFISFLAINCGGESSTCLTVYKEGGAPAVFQSPKCPRWNLHNWASPTGGHCHTAAIQGRRNYQEDRLLCALDLRIPFPGKTGTKDVLVGIAAVFDGHNGAEASDMASKLLLDYFALHINFLLDATFSAMTRMSIGRLPTQGEHGVILHGSTRDEIMHLYNLDFKMQFQESLPLNFDDSLHLDIIKEALLRAIHDIDATFTKEASIRKLNSGSTATVALIADGQLMVASIGDSKALLCSEKIVTPEEARATLVKLYLERRRNRGSSPSRFSDFELEHSHGLLRLIAKELTKDHRPNRKDEKIRVEAAGGYVTEWAGVPRVNGQLSVSRSIGDLTYKSVISAPEVMDWQPLLANDSYLVLSSDGIFEKLELQEVCDRLWEVGNQTSSGAGLPSYCSISLADCLVNTAFDKGSMDNMAAVVVPLRPNIDSHLQRKEQCMSDSKEKMASALPSNTCALPLPIDISWGPLQLKQAQPFATMFNRSLVEVKNGSFCFFYISENLIGASQGHIDDLNGYMGDLPLVLPASAEPFFGWCLSSGTAITENQDKCISPDSFSTFLGLLESVPFHGFGANNGTDEISIPDSSYVLKKKFGRGAFGEVWLAFHWNCYQGTNTTNWIEEDENTAKKGVHINEHIDNLTSNTSMDHFDDGPENLFILKRILVERGPAVYLSGLREKHFGEVFLSAYNVSGSSTRTQASSSQSAPSELDLSQEGLKHIARYIEHFESRYNDIWLVFHHEGVSLSKLMYTVGEAANNSADEKAEKASHGQILGPSKWWTWLKTTESGKEEMRRIIWHLLLGLKACHDRNITHRDIKPENMVICLEDIKSGRCLKGVPNGDQNFKTKMRIIDFGSALDEFTMTRLYGSTGPSRAEQTHDYSPPEAVLNSSWHRGPTSLTLKYDMWSVGVVMLEMILGTPNVFEVSSVTRALLDQHIRGWSENFKELAYKLRSFMEMCILIPGSSLKHGGASSKQGGISLASWKCSEEFFAEQIKSRDPLKIGFPSVRALRLVWGLLQWYPEDRLDVDEALHHPYFQPPPSSSG